MRTPISVHHARLDGRDWRVIRPAGWFAHAGLWDEDWWLRLRVDRGSAHRLGVLWLLAARSRHTIIHVPLRTGDHPVRTDPQGRRMDLVLSQHSLQLRAARWPRLRAALDKGKPETAQLPESDLPDPAEIGYGARHHRENRDLLNEQVHADTVFLAGSAPVFRQTASRFFDLAQLTPEPDAHVCTEFHSGDGVLGNAREIHVEYHADWARS
ncbi:MULTISPECIES: hypothetical protein [unclassified Crossiella]|uniref:hypothetical protein n=1 Tax=unclassified Crossiella TaxID=2620835 RepID=UPI001FFFE8F9|nr:MULTISPECIES: hypothetical protein [unclassified Crossiella]MCK2244589.1 hypothetical protein [Crossiella sp. S99.2]MCK2258220.1 hypothetical protein [Crossiella sp. S99.1]